MKMKTPTYVARLEGPAERVRQSHHDAIVELQTLPASQMIVVGDFVVPNGGQVVVSHKLGRAPRLVLFSPPRVQFGTPGLVAGGILVDLPGPDIDRSKSIRILAAGYGCAVTVTVTVL